MLSQGGVAFERRELFRQPLTEPEIRALLGTRSPREVVSLRSQRAQALGWTEDTLPGDDALIKLLAQEPGLWRRPVIIVGDELVVGYDAERIGAVLRQR